MFCLLEVPCEPLAIKDPDPAKCEARLMAFVENYFQSAVEDPTQRIRQTKLPPLYFQHAGGSLVSHLRRVHRWLTTREQVIP